jgi:hypothetical protein
MSARLEESEFQQAYALVQNAHALVEELAAGRDDWLHVGAWQRLRIDLQRTVEDFELLLEVAEQPA